MKEKNFILIIKKIKIIKVYNYVTSKNDSLSKKSFKSPQKLHLCYKRRKYYTLVCHKKNRLKKKKITKLYLFKIINRIAKLLDPFKNTDLG